MKVDLDQRSDAWHEWRKGKIGSSAAATIMDCNPFETKYDLWHKLKGLSVEMPETEAMKRGRVLEDEAREWYNNRHIPNNGPYTFVPACFQSEEYAFLIASLDGYCELCSTVMEIKCSDYYYDQAKKDIVPDSVKWQIRHQQLCSNADFGVFVAYNGFEGLCIYCDRDENEIDQLLAKELEFYESLKEEVCPWSQCKRDYVKVEVAHDDVDTIVKWKKAHQALEDAKVAEKILREAVCDLGDDGDLELCWEGIPLIKMTRVSREGNVDWKKLCADKGISEKDILPYRKKEIGYYKLTQI